MRVGIVRSFVGAAVLSTVFACGPTEETPFVVDPPAGHTFEDASGQQWTYRGKLHENHALHASFLPVDATALDPEATSASDVPSLEDLDDDQPEERVSYVLVGEGELGDWDVYEQHRDEEIIAELDARYLASLGDLSDAVEIDENYPTPANARIIGADDRVPLSDDILTVGGSTDNLVQIRRLDVGLANIPAGFAARCTATMLTSTIGLTAAHCFTANNGNTSVITPGILVSDGTQGVGGDLVTSNMIFVNGAYRNDTVFRSDWALFRTNTSIPGGLGSGRFILDSSNNEGAGTRVFNVGVPGTQAFAHGGGCEIQQDVRRRLSYDCDTVDGHSGGPVYRVMRSNGRTFRAIVAVHAGAWWPNNRGSKVSFWRPAMVNGMNALSTGTGEVVP